jgi:multicomponent Na+:H+ antiporter subunit D
MLVGMGILALLCIVMGVYPWVLYDMLPFPVEYVPFTLTRVFSITQMFIFTFLGFWLLRKLVRGYSSYVLDTDWPARIMGMRFVRFCMDVLPVFGSFLDTKINRAASAIVAGIRSPVIEMKLTPVAIGMGILLSLVLFSVYLVLRM